jgi:hypothetical protein
MTMAKMPELTVKIILVDTIAEMMGYTILDKAEFTRLVNRELVELLAPRLHLTDLEQKGIIKKVSA